ncbi:MAG: hypothetical protein JRI72_13960 [Deltaproteobacteria bacterium]|nr:hypothetical protein [Deltaproteobacteria bacterium]
MKRTAKPGLGQRLKSDLCNDMRDSLKETQPQTLIFTDLDGTLLDDQTYDFTPALPALKIIHSLLSW